MVKLESIHIKDIGPISDLRLDFNDNFNVICGQNGIGKTTILDCIAQAFNQHTVDVKKSAGKEFGEYSLTIKQNNQSETVTSKIVGFHPNEQSRGDHNRLYVNSVEIIVFKTHRDIPYIRLNSVNTDAQKDIHSLGEEIRRGSNTSDIKNWFVNRYLFSAQTDSLAPDQIKNYELAKYCFTILNPNITFSKVIPSTFDVMLNSPIGEIYFEYLSSGYKSSLAILIGLIKEIELRFKNPSVFVKDFKGIVFIDEIDLHLHPEWQAKIYSAIKEILPQAQIVCSTHSPHIIQVADANEIIALSYDENMQVKVNSLINQEYGCQGWTVEEILTDVMGISETRTELYTNSIAQFNDAMDTENYTLANSAFEVLDKMLHPDNSLRKILKIQLAGLSDND